MTTLNLSPTEKDPCNWIKRMVNLAEPGTRIVYSRDGRNETVMQYARDLGGVVFDGKNVTGRVRLHRMRDDGQLVYVMVT